MRRSGVEKQDCKGHNDDDDDEEDDEDEEDEEEDEDDEEDEEEDEEDDEEDDEEEAEELLPADKIFSVPSWAWLLTPCGDDMRPQRLWRTASRSMLPHWSLSVLSVLCLLLLPFVLSLLSPSFSTSLLPPLSENDPDISGDSPSTPLAISSSLPVKSTNTDTWRVRVRGTGRVI